VTTIRHYASATQSVTDTFQYDDVGNVASHTDPNGHATTMSYADNFVHTTPEYGLYSFKTFAFPTAQTNAASQTARIEFDYNTGLVTTSKDVRSLATKRTYDALNRLKAVTAPDAGVTSYAYDDATPALTEQTAVASGVFLQTQTYFDKFYRPARTVQSDPIAGDVSIYTEYDGDGRVKRVSEPYRTGTKFWTTTSYDAVNRPTSVTNPDSTTIQFQYFGNAVQQTDEANNPRILTYDALGRLFQVEEPDPIFSPPSLAHRLTANYRYYMFGPLYQVNQSSETQSIAPRTITRNWLGLVTSEQHPESGMTNYVYYPDNTGINTPLLVHTRTDARGVTATYGYDNLDR
jgi:YD repeat-containing protein